MSFRSTEAEFRAGGKPVPGRLNNGKSRVASWYMILRAWSVVAACTLLIAGSAWGEGPHADEGMRIFKSANCVGCHKWSGTGGGGYGGAAANLRATELTADQI